ncbi:MAG: UrcA family protein [Gammaproteobacteria bacterium]
MRRYTKMKTAIHALLGTAYLASLGACTDVYAANAPSNQSLEFAQRTVKFADLDLTRAEGAATLYSRIRSAARLVCTPTFATWEWEAAKSARPCIDKAIDHAVADVNAPALTSYYTKQTRQTIRLAAKQ